VEGLEDCRMHGVVRKGEAEGGGADRKGLELAGRHPAWRIDEAIAGLHKGVNRCGKGQWLRIQEVRGWEVVGRRRRCGGLASRGGGSLLQCSSIESRRKWGGALHITSFWGSMFVGCLLSYRSEPAKSEAAARHPPPRLDSAPPGWSAYAPCPVSYLGCCRPRGKAQEHGHIVQADSIAVFGAPQVIAVKLASSTSETTNTSSVECHNVTQHQSHRRLTRRTNSCSKDLSWFERPLWRSLASYHLVRPYCRFRRAPAEAYARCRIAAMLAARPRQAGRPD
jgi:hypothetical protein